MEMKVRDLESEQSGLKGGGDRRASISHVQWQMQSNVGGVGGALQNVAISQLSKKLEEVHDELEGKNNTIKELSMQVETLNPKRYGPWNITIEELSPKVEARFWDSGFGSWE
jgi:hypothetical protein